MMRVFSKPTLSICLALFLTSNPFITAQAAKAKTVTTQSGVVTVNGVVVPKYRADVLVNEQTAQGVSESAELHSAVREKLVRLEILEQAAKKKGLDKKPEVIGQIELNKQALLAQAYMQDYIKGQPLSEAVLRKEYVLVTQQLGTQEYKARHILVEKESDAQSIIAKLNKGEKFEELAKQSKDLGSKDQGGELGWATLANYVKPFADALGGLEKGKFSTTPVKSEFGYHVILLEDVRPIKLPSFEEAKPQLQQRLQQQIMEQQIKTLREQAKVK